MKYIMYNFDGILCICQHLYQDISHLSRLYNYLRLRMQCIIHYKNRI